ncbi:RagB/SusD family nutrient uptake outer membrane protein [Aquiflexum sp. TKW24L]|uniref:RagB/SusD family nutrient uptake outer membrane protein n=1 Tax=Aquiflexum sp. TKW24L TaxID=2942212 RepID=UPI0020BF0967|nr:RagB/SusD family nutrient uptake outer membrane protein [Aquiflexum sp. TKW24L]MCL6258261.1 RagB/SusD family nutrient uptake outer membrane protein [Aquiflexum sp. TKW24L]
MKNFRYITLIVLLAFSACTEDYLDRGSLTELASGNFWQSESDAQLGVNGIYAALQDRVLYSGNLNALAGIPQHDCFADNAYNNYKFEGPGNFVEGRLDPSNAYFNAFWAANYRGIGRANTAIENIEQISGTNITEDARKVLLGQAHFLRAMFYFNLAVYFEDVPLILEVQTLEQAYVPKNTYAEVQTAIIADLQTAIASLPERYPADQFGYATKGAALSLLARFHLYNKNFAEVITLTSEVMSLGYGLYNNYGQLFSQAGELSNEIVFSVRFIQNQSNNGETFSATFEGIPRVNEQPMRNLVNDYYCTDGLPINESPLYNPNNIKVNRDPRLGSTVYFQGDIFLIHLNRAFQGNTATRFARKKYTRNNLSPEGIGVGSPGGQDFYVIRYADVLLMRAEALAETGQFSEVYDLVNQVRARVSMPKIENVEGAGLNQTQLIQIVRHERRVEFAFEGLRFFDVKRWGEVKAAYDRATADPVPPYNPVYKGRMSEVFPIPQSELDANKNLIQNPVWN